MKIKHDTTDVGDELISLARLQMHEYFIATLGAMGISPQQIEQQSTVIDLWQTRLAELTSLGFEPTQLDEMMRSFAEIWFPPTSESHFSSTVATLLLNTAPQQE
jgi:hypothetical protein